MTASVTVEIGREFGVQNDLISTQGDFNLPHFPYFAGTKSATKIKINISTAYEKVKVKRNFNERRFKLT